VIDGVTPAEGELGVARGSRERGGRGPVGQTAGRLLTKPRDVALSAGCRPSLGGRAPSSVSPALRPHRGMEMPLLLAGWFACAPARPARRRGSDEMMMSRPPYALIIDTPRAPSRCASSPCAYVCATTTS
jgi:hypothetical protein